MKEQEFLSVIKSIAGDKYIGDDCAYIKEIGIVLSQDSLVEGVHFSMEYTTPYQLGYKSAMVNISDIAASGALPAYMSVALSLPKDISSEFIKEFYTGLKTAGENIEIVGGDLTGSDKIMISVSIIGKAGNRRISSRSGAKTGYVVITNGSHGSSAGGLKLLTENKKEPQKLVNAHLMPSAGVEFASQISKNIDKDYAMMDSSDGLADSLYKIAHASNKTLVLDFDKVVYDEELKNSFPDDYENMILYGGEDYKIIAAVPEKFARNLDNAVIIGHVEDKTEDVPLKILKNGLTIPVKNLDKCFNHFS